MIMLSRRIPSIFARKCSRYLLLSLLFLLATSVVTGKRPLTNRDLQVFDDAPVYLPLWFSIWFPSANNEDDLDVEELMEPMNEIQVGVLDALEQVLCSETDLILTDRTAISGDVVDKSVYANHNVCESRRRTLRSADDNDDDARRRRSLQSSGTSILDHKGTVEIAQRSAEGLTWSVWTVNYTVLQIGNVYYAEAHQNNPDLAGVSQFHEAALEAMKEVVQLALDVVLMERGFDELLQSTLDMILYSSPVRIETEMFAMAKAEYDENYTFTPGTWSPMRIAGVALMVVSMASAGLLTLLAKRRRKRIIANEMMPLDEDLSLVLKSPAGVDLMLDQSANFVPSSPSPPTSPRRPSVEHTSASRLPVPNLGRVALEILEEEMNIEDSLISESNGRAVSSLGAPYGELDENDDDNDDDDNESITEILRRAKLASNKTID